MNVRTASPHVIIIGAGPAGLAVALCLARRGVGYTLLERGPTPLTSLRRIDPEMELLSPMRLSRLPGMPMPPGLPSYPTFPALADVLQDYAQQQAVTATTNADVVSVEGREHDFVVQYRDAGGAMQTARGSHVISATGLISAPKLPDDFDPEACTFPWLHSIDTRSKHIEKARRLLVVGGGTSAAEVLERWLDVRRADDRAWLSLRSKLLAFWHWPLGIDVHYWIWLPEHLTAGLLPWQAGRFREPMLSWKVPRALRRGIITRLSSIRYYQGAQVIPAADEPLEPDLVVFATGFCYATEHLDGLLDYDPGGRPRVRAGESTRTPGLYLMGFRYSRSLASPYLRGIARDAAYIACRIAG